MLLRHNYCLWVFVEGLEWHFLSVLTHETNSATGKTRDERTVSEPVSKRGQCESEKILCYCKTQWDLWERRGRGTEYMCYFFASCPVTTNRTNSWSASDFKENYLGKFQCLLYI